MISSRKHSICRPTDFYWTYVEKSLYDYGRRALFKSGISKHKHTWVSCLGKNSGGCCENQKTDEEKLKIVTCQGSAANGKNKNTKVMNIVYTVFLVIFYILFTE